jgi:hypothetical protein
MRRLILLLLSIVAAMACATSSAFAGPGLNLAWSACRGEASSTTDRAFACDSNVGVNLLVVSFELPHDQAQVSGNEVVLDLLSQAPTLPAWWDFKDVGTCRQTSLGFNITADAGNVVCADWAQGHSAGGIASYRADDADVAPVLFPRHRRIKVALAVSIVDLQDLVAGTEYFSCNLTVDNLKTVGTGSCGGCTEPICIVLNSITVRCADPSTDVYMTSERSPGSNLVTWQGLGPDCLAVPTKNATWGQVKALYR